MKAKHLAPLCVLLLFCSWEAAAQPTCFNNFYLPNSCPPQEDIILIGRVITFFSVDETREDDPSGYKVLRGPVRGRVVVAVEEVLKGEAAVEVELRFRSGCAGFIQKNEKYVFAVKKTSDGLFAQSWSNNLETMSPEDVAQSLEVIRSLVSGERQPRLFGTLRNVDRPVPDITVVAEKGEERFETNTDASGRYEFRELPEGEYQVNPILPESLRPANDDNRQPRERYDYRVPVTDQGLCGARVDFLAWPNGVISGRVEDADGNPVKDVRIGLSWLIDKDVGQGAPYPADEVWGPQDGEFSFINLAPGPYLLVVDTEGRIGSDGKRIGTLYYPGGVDWEEEAHPLDLAPGQKVTGLVIKLPR